jgi:Tol biopolymer transport system component
VQIGQQLGSYEITSLLGKGGMGEVYKAYDTRLDRTVAIKVLPAHVAHDPESRERLQREARAVAALNHPHICTLHDIGSHDGIDFLVMEFLEGETLATRLAKGPLPVDQALRYAVQIASALDKAHAASIVHRDLKPGNIMLTKSGAKLLDFGLAKASVALVADMPTRLTASDLTAPGAIVGTLQYMAPEQIEGKKTDARTDIFAFGAVLYEMLIGEKAFDGKSQALLIAAILERDPAPLTTRLAVAPPALERLIKRCVSKDPDGRWQSAGDLTSEIEWIAQTRAEANASGLGVSRGKDGVSRARMAWLAAALAIVVAAIFAVRAFMDAARPAAADPLVVQHVARMTRENGFSEWPTWSSDGRFFAFSSNRNGNFELYVGRVEGGQDVVNVTNNAADDVQPAFSPDGATIAFVSTRSSRTGLIKIAAVGFDTRTYGGDVWVTPALGGQARRLAENGNFPVWHPNTRTLLYVTGQENHRAIAAVSIDGGPPNPILPESASTWEIVRLGYSPDARWITFETSDRRLFVMPASGGQPTELLRGSSHVWDPSGRRIYYVNQEPAGGTRIEAVDVQQGAAKPTAMRVSVVGVSTGALHELAIAPDGKHLLASGVEESMNLTRVRLAPGGGDVAGPEEELSSGQVRDNYPAISPDGQRIAVSSNRVGEEDLWIVDLSSTRWQRVLLPADTGDRLMTESCWAKDGQHLAVKTFFRNGTAALWYTAIDGSSTPELLPPMPSLSGNFPCAFSPDGRHLVHAHLAGNFSQLFVLDVASRREQQLTRSESDKYEAAWSPDGLSIAFSANTGGTVQVWRIPVGGGEERQMTTGDERVLHLFYSPDGRWLYVQPSHRNIYRMPSDGGPLQPVTRFPESGLFIEEPKISPDGRYLVYNRGHGGSSLWMLTIGASASH